MVGDIKELVPLLKRFNEIEAEYYELDTPVKRKLRWLSLKSNFFSFLNYTHSDIILGVDSWLQMQIIKQQLEEVNRLRKHQKKLLQELEEIGMNLQLGLVERITRGGCDDINLE